MLEVSASISHKGHVVTVRKLPGIQESQVRRRAVRHVEFESRDIRPGETVAVRAGLDSVGVDVRVQEKRRAAFLKGIGSVLQICPKISPKVKRIGSCQRIKTRNGKVFIASKILGKRRYFEIPSSGDSWYQHTAVGAVEGAQKCVDGLIQPPQNIIRAFLES